MHRRRLTLQRFFLAGLLLALPAAARCELRLLPEPRSVTLREGRFAFRAPVVISVAAGDAEDRFAAGLLAEEIAAATGTPGQVVDGRHGAIVLDRAGAPAELGEEGYRLDVQPSRVRLVARTAAGMFYAVQTLRQMVEPDGIPAATIVDWPALRWRGVHDDLSRGPVPTLESLKRRVQTAADFKLNFYVLYLEGCYGYQKHPLIGPPGGALEEGEVRELVAYARRFHVELVPEQQTLGHLRQVLKYESYADLAEIPNGSTLAPGPKVNDFIRSLYDELVPVFPGPFLHLGADEVSELGQGRSREQVAKLGQVEVYVQHLRELHELLNPYGKRLIFWGDILKERPDLIPQVPGDMVVASWYYLPADDYGPWVRPFRDAGLDVIVCPGTSNWNRVFPNLDIALPNIRSFIREGQRGKALGALTCTWIDDGDGLFGLNWYPLAYGAAASWQEGDCDPARLKQVFDWAFFRNPGTQVAQAIEQINSAHRLIRSVCPTDANTQLMWQHPVHVAAERRTMVQLAPIAAPLRLAQEQAIQLVEQARPRVHRNADILDELGFVARRLHSIGLRANLARRVPELYQQAVDSIVPGQQAMASIQTLALIIVLLVDGRENAVALRAEHERLWLSENRPYWLGNILSLYDRDIQLWIEELNNFRYYEVLLRGGARPPSPAELGLAP